jgi:CHAT domain-containing protein
MSAALIVPLGAQDGSGLLNLAYDNYEAGKWAEAQAFAQKAAEKFKLEAHASGWIQAQLIVAYSRYDGEGDIFAAQQVLQGIYQAQWLKLKTEDDHYRYCKALLLDGWLCRSVGDVETSKTRLEAAYAIFKKHLPEKGHKIAGDLFAELGNAYVRLKEYAGARQVFEENIAYSARYPACAKFNDYGSLFFSLGDRYLDTALNIFQRGLDFSKKTPLPPAEVKLLLLNKAECLAKMGRFSEALKANLAAEKYPLAPSDDRYDRCTYGTFENYGIICATMARAGQTDKFPLAVRWYQKAIEWVEKMESPPKRELSGFYVALGEVYQSWGKTQEAKSAFQRAITVLLPRSASGNPPASALYAEAMLIRALQGKAKAFVAEGKWEQALECYELIPIVEAKLRANHSYESSSLHALKESRARFHDAVDIAWKCYEQSNGNPRFAERAFRLAEWSRGMLLLQSLVQAKKFLPDELRQRDYALQTRIAKMEREIAAEQDKEKAADQQFLKEKSEQMLGLKIERQQNLAAYPAYRQPDSLLLQVADVSKALGLLGKSQALVDYFLTEKAAYVFSFEKNAGFRWRRAPLPEQFKPDTERFAQFLWAGEEKGREVFLAHARLLDSLLFEPERKLWGANAAKRVVVVPDDVLALVPFDVLTSGTVGQKSWGAQQWLLREHSFSYAYSVSLLSEQMAISAEQKKAGRVPKLYGGFAPSYSDSEGYDFVETYPMVEKVKAILGGGQTWGGKQASEWAFKQEGPLCRILLLAMHGLSDNERPELSRLKFGKDAEGAGEDNELYASELQLMRLRAELVFLSACHSGAGKLEQGEGVYSLARAFAAARAPATVMSLWLLQGSAARPMVESFFGQLKKGLPKDEALKEAKTAFLRDNGELSHPFYWAGLAAVGDMRPIEFGANTPWSLAVSLAVLAIAAATAFWLKRQRVNT